MEEYCCYYLVDVVYTFPGMRDYKMDVDKLISKPAFFNVWTVFSS